MYSSVNRKQNVVYSLLNRKYVFTQIKRLAIASSIVFVSSACASYTYSVQFSLTEDLCGGAPVTDGQLQRDAASSDLGLYLFINGKKTLIRTDGEGQVRIEGLSRGDSLAFLLPERIETPVEIQDDLCKRYQTTPDHLVIIESRKFDTASVALHKPCNPCLLEEPFAPPMPHN